MLNSWGYCDFGTLCCIAHNRFFNFPGKNPWDYSKSNIKLLCILWWDFDYRKIQVSSWCNDSSTQEIYCVQWRNGQKMSFTASAFILTFKNYPEYNFSICKEVLYCENLIYYAGCYMLLTRNIGHAVHIYLPPPAPYELCSDSCVVYKCVYLNVV